MSLACRPDPALAMNRFRVSETVGAKVRIGETAYATVVFADGTRPSCP